MKASSSTVTANQGVKQQVSMAGSTAIISWLLEKAIKLESSLHIVRTQPEDPIYHSKYNVKLQEAS